MGTKKEFFLLLDIQKALRNISTLTVQERELVEKELMAKYRPDYRLTRSEIIKVVTKLFQKYKISRSDKDSIFRRFGITSDEIRRYY